MNTLGKLSHDISFYISNYKQNREHASTNTTCYKACKYTMTRIAALCGFAERYLGYEISIHTGGEVTQFTPVDILGFSIEKKEEEEE